MSGGDVAAPRKRAKTSILGGWGKRLLLDSGLWELLFPTVLSPELVHWVADFQPDVIYATVTDLGYMRLASLLHDRFDLPICLHINNWPNTLYRDSCFGRLMFPWSGGRFERLLAKSAICLTIGKEMESDYRNRYQGTFEGTDVLR